MIDKLSWIYVQQGKVLCVRSKGKDLFYIPGGKRDPGEDDQQALIREIQEELSVDLNADSIEFLFDLTAPADGKPEGTLVKLTCYQADYTGDLNVAAEIAEMAWLDSSDKAKGSTGLKMIFDQLKASSLIN